MLAGVGPGGVNEPTGGHAVGTEYSPGHQKAHRVTLVSGRQRISKSGPREQRSEGEGKVEQGRWMECE